MIDDWNHLYFFPLPDTLTNRPHFIAADLLGGRLIVPKLTICWHRLNKWPPGLKRVRRLTKVRASGFRCPYCHSSVLRHSMLVMNGTILFCRCMLVSVANKLHQPDSAELWQKTQLIYAKAEACAEEFPLPPSGLYGWN